MKDGWRGKKNKSQGRHFRIGSGMKSKISPQVKLGHTKKLQFQLEIPDHRELLPMLALPTQIRSEYHVIG